MGLVWQNIWSEATWGHLPVHLDCLPDRAPGPYPSPVLSELLGAGPRCSLVEGWWEERAGEQEARGTSQHFCFQSYVRLGRLWNTRYEHFVSFRAHLCEVQPQFQYHQSGLGGRILERSRLALERQHLKYPRESICKPGPATAGSFPKWQAQYNSLWSCYLNRVPSPALSSRVFAGESLRRFFSFCLVFIG